MLLMAMVGWLMRITSRERRKYNDSPTLLLSKSFSLGISSVLEVEKCFKQFRNILSNFLLSTIGEGLLSDKNKMLQSLHMSAILSIPEIFLRTRGC